MKFEIVCFDCDSTLSYIEGIDQCARAVSLGVEMEMLTNAAMNGELALEDVYQQRLELIRPRAVEVTALADIYIKTMVDGVREVFATLAAKGAEVHIISGGLRQAILPLAAELNIPVANVHAVDIYFNADGHYIGFDMDSPLARSGGKAQVCQQINPTGKKMVLVGDGKTDLEAQTVGVQVIGYGGVVRREIVAQQADFYVDEANLTAVLEYIL